MINSKTKKLLRKRALEFDINHTKTFSVDISKYEYCTGKIKVDFEGFNIYVYSPIMIVCEKLRSLCQQSVEYSKKLHKNRSPRSKDFVDIYFLTNKYKLELNIKENIELLHNIFDIKRVNFELLKKIKNEREFHRQDFESVRQTIKQNQSINEFDYYFDYVINLIDGIKDL
jgi:hypothetical protein